LLLDKVNFRVHFKVQFRFYLKLEDYTAESFTRGLLHIYIYICSSPVQLRFYPKLEDYTRQKASPEDYARQKASPEDCSPVDCFTRPAESFTRGLLTSGLLHQKTTPGRKLHQRTAHQWTAAYIYIFEFTG